MTLTNSTVPPVLVYRSLCVVDVKRTLDLSRRAAADLRFRLRGPWDSKIQGASRETDVFEI